MGQGQEERSHLVEMLIPSVTILRLARGRERLMEEEMSVRELREVFQVAAVVAELPLMRMEQMAP